MLYPIEIHIPWPCSCSSNLENSCKKVSYAQNQQKKQPNMCKISSMHRNKKVHFMSISYLAPGMGVCIHQAPTALWLAHGSQPSYRNFCSLLNLEREAWVTCPGFQIPQQQASTSIPLGYHHNSLPLSLSPCHSSCK